MTTTNKWTATDSTQFMFKRNENTFEYVEALSLNDEVHVINHAIIEITDYDTENILKYIKPYGYETIDKVKKEYGADYKQIICECIFESMDENRYISSLDLNEIIDIMNDEFNIKLDKSDF